MVYASKNKSLIDFIAKAQYGKYPIGYEYDESVYVGNKLICHIMKPVFEVKKTNKN